MIIPPPSSTSTQPLFFSISVNGISTKKPRNHFSFFPFSHSSKFNKTSKRPLNFISKIYPKSNIVHQFQLPPPNPRHYHTLLFGLVLTSSFTLGQTIPSAHPPPALSSYCGKKKNLKCEPDYIISLFRTLLWLSIEPRVKIKVLPNSVSLI